MTTPSSWPPDHERGATTPWDTPGAATPGVPPGYPGAYGYPVQRPTNGFAIAALVLGIVWIYWIGSILALIFGYIARKQIRERGEGGDGLAIAGIVLGWVGVGVLALVLIFLTVGVTSSGFSPG